jgi:hypothetical protein
MHRVITNAGKGEYVDHINGDKLLNVRANLRLCTASQNLANRGLFKNSTTGFIGVSFEHGRWRAHIQKDDRIIFLSVYDNIKSAALARDYAAKLLFGEFARLNLPIQPIPYGLQQKTERHLLRHGYRVVTVTKK